MEGATSAGAAVLDRRAPAVKGKDLEGLKFGRGLAVVACFIAPGDRMDIDTQFAQREPPERIYCT